MRQHLALLAVRALVLLAFGCTAATAIRAQAGPRQVKLSERQTSALERETERKRDPKATLAQVNEDLSRLRVLNEALTTHAAASDQMLNYKSIVENVSEIKKRSTRLRTDLALPKEEREQSRVGMKEIENGLLQPGLLTLNELLVSFLHNPIFSDSGPIDQQLAAKAKLELDDIVVLSDKLRKMADRLNKSLLLKRRR